MAKKKSFTNGHKTFTVPENRFLSTIYEKEEKQRRCHGEKRFLKERNPLVAEPTARLSEFAEFLSSKESARRKESARSKGTGRRGLTGRTGSESLSARSSRAFDYDRDVVDPRFSARTHDSSARSVISTGRKEVQVIEDHENNVKAMLQRKQWLEKQLSELDEEIRFAKSPTK